MSLAVTFLTVGWSCVVPAARAEEMSSLAMATPDYTAIYAPLVESLFSRAGARVTIKSYPAERSYQMLLDGQIDGEFFRQSDAVQSIRDSATLIGPLTCVEVAAYVRADSGISVRSISDLIGFRLGALRGNKLPAGIAVAARADTELPATDEQLMRMLEAKRIDVALQTRRIALATLKRLGWRNVIVQSGPLLANPPSYLVLRRQRDVWSEKLQKAANTLLDSGDWRRGYNEINISLGLPRDTGLSCIKGGAH